MMKYTLSFLLLFFAVVAFSQETTTDSSAIIKPNQIYTGCISCFLLNNHIYSRSKLDSFLVANPIAHKEYSRYKTANRISSTFGVLFFAGLVGGLVTINNSNNISGKIYSASLIPLIVAGHFGGRAGKHFSKAINYYNNGKN
ncbi:hypothetical protein [Parasediminibacterium sp. JCM 36343]|uniref:hypothetical protein n=1 Tax=Parasediminibacterium sp. JCM 36343 TaxID=3374279 RepID=UPI00397CAB09